MFGQSRLADVGLHASTLEQRGLHAGFLRLVWLALSLSVVAIIEPSPGDIGVAFLLVAGFIFGKLSWSRLPALPLALLGLFVLANLVSLCYAVDVSYGASYGLVTLFMLTLWLFIVGVVTRFEERGLRVLMSGYAVGGILSAALALLAYVGVLSKMTSSVPYLNLLQLDDMLLYFGERLRGFFKDPNVFGPYLVVVAAYALCCLQARPYSYIRKMFWAASCLICSLGILMCFSRAAWANYVVTIAVLLLLKAMAARARGGARRNIVYFLICAVIVGAAVAYTLTNTHVSEFAADRSEIQSYDEDRFTKQAQALDLGLRNPLGAGPGQSHLLLGYNPHSLPLGVFAENGIIGLLSLMGFVLATLIRSLVLSQQAANNFQRSMFALVAAAIAGTLLNSVVIDPIHWRHLWLLLAIGWMPVWKQTKELSSHSRSGQENPAPTITNSEAFAWR
jgi:O-antigen ligase